MTRRTPAAGVLLAATLAAGCGRSSGVPDPANELPFGRVDAPVEGAEVTAQSSVAGWALDDRGVREIRVYEDGHFVSAGTIADDRPDVSKAFPQYVRGSDRHGWALGMVFDAPGPHIVIVQAVDTDGATREIGTLHVTVVEK